MYMGLKILGRQNYTAEPLVPEPRAFAFKLAIEELKSHKSSDIDQIPTELIKVVGRAIGLRSIN